jgi:predicted transcriptional regulator
MMTLGAIENSNLIKSTQVDLQKVHENFIQLLGGAKTIFGISPIFHEDYIIVLRKVLNQPESKITLIVTNTVLDKFKQLDDTQLNKHITEGNLQIFLNDNLKIALTVTEKNWSMGLFTLSGEYDYTNDLVGTGKEGVEWGYQLFKTILEQSTKI